MATEEKKAAPKKQSKENGDELSPADLELTLTAPRGPEITKKVNPETPTQAQVDAATAEIPGPAVTKLTVEGEDASEHELRPDDAALLTQRVGSDAAHPANTEYGHGGNPRLKEPTDEEREADQEAYASRVG